MGNLEHVKKHYLKQKKSKQVAIFKGSVNQIILIRHGEPDVIRKKSYRRNDVLEYDKEYYEAHIKPYTYLPIDLESLKNPIIYHSTLRRATHTAELIFGEKFSVIPDGRFKEFERGVISFFGLALPLNFWTALSRILWFVGISSKEIESVKSAKKRARENARYLEEISYDHNEAIILVAHGWHNRYVVRYLKKRSWQKVFDSGHKFLGMQVMVHL